MKSLPRVYRSASGSRNCSTWNTSAGRALSQDASVGSAGTRAADESTRHSSGWITFPRLSCSGWASEQQQPASGLQERLERHQHPRLDADGPNGHQVEPLEHPGQRQQLLDTGWFRRRAAQTEVPDRLPQERGLPDLDFNHRQPRRGPKRERQRDGGRSAARPDVEEILCGWRVDEPGRRHDGSSRRRSMASSGSVSAVRLIFRFQRARSS